MYKEFLKYNYKDKNWLKWLNIWTKENTDANQKIIRVQTITKENKHMEACSVWYVFREMQINPRYHSSFFRMAKSRTLILFHPGKDGGASGTLIHCWWEYKMQ